MSARHERVVTDPTIMLGKPTIRGTRVTVELILRKLGEGLPVEDLLAAYPQLRIDDVHAAQGYAADVLANDDILHGPSEAA